MRRITRLTGFFGSRSIKTNSVAYRLKKSLLNDTNKEVTLPILLTLSGSAAVLYYLISIDRQQEVLAQPSANSKSALVINTNDIEQDEYSSLIICPTLNKTFFTKKPVDRQRFIRELLTGQLVHELCANTSTPSPSVYAIERSVDADTSYYSFASENIGPNRKNTDLATVMKSRQTSVDRIPLKNLGVAIAINRLLGNSDSNLNNFIVSEDRTNAGNHYIYSVDFEYALMRDASFINSAEQSLEMIVEFQHALPALAGMMQSERSYLSDQAKQALVNAVETDIQNGAINALYENFANMIHEQLTSIVNNFGALIHEDEKMEFMDEIQHRQAATREYLALKQNVNTTENVVRLRC